VVRMLDWQLVAGWNGLFPGGLLFVLSVLT